jgi:hypothetical protein
VGVVCITAFGLLFLLGYFITDYIYTSKQLRKHQEEWNRRKARAITNGEDLLDAYCEYLDYLMVFDQHPLFGIGIPRFKG